MNDFFTDEFYDLFGKVVKDFYPRFKNNLLEDKHHQTVDRIPRTSLLNMRNSGFVEKENDTFELKVNLPKEITSNDYINVELEEENSVKVSYKFEKDNCKMSGRLMTTLPEEADSKTLTATFKNNELILLVNRKTVAKNRKITID